MTLAPLRLSEAGSLAKASTPEPFSTSRTSNWVARKGGLPPYVQHIAHDLMEKGGKTESEAIRLAIGIVKNPPDKWGPEAKAAAKKAAAEWEAKKGASSPGAAAKSAGKRLAEAHIGLTDRVALRRAAAARLKTIEECYGAQVMSMMMEAAASSPAWSPELKRTASGSSEIERHEVHDDGQHVGYLIARQGYGPGNSRPTRYSAKSVNGRLCSETMDSKAGALDGLKKHLEEAPARVSAHRAGRFLVANPDSYSGPTTMTEYPSESSARYAAGLPEQPSSVEKRAKVVALGEMIAYDGLTLELLGEELPDGLGTLQEGGFSRVFDEAKHPRGAHGRFSVGDRVNFQHSHFGRVPARVTKVDSRRVHLSSSDPRVRDTSMTHKQAEGRLSTTTKAPKTAQDAQRQVAKKGVELKREGDTFAVHHDGKKVGAKMTLTDATRMVNRLRSEEASHASLKGPRR